MIEKYIEKVENLISDGHEELIELYSVNQEDTAWHLEQFLTETKNFLEGIKDNLSARLPDGENGIEED